MSKVQIKAPGLLRQHTDGPETDAPVDVVTSLALGDWREVAAEPRGVADFAVVYDYSDGHKRGAEGAARGTKLQPSDDDKVHAPLGRAVPPRLSLTLPRASLSPTAAQAKAVLAALFSVAHDAARKRQHVDQDLEGFQLEHADDVAGQAFRVSARAKALWKKVRPHSLPGRSPTLPLAAPSPTCG